MEISQELRDKIVADFRAIELELVKDIQSKEWKTNYVFCPFFSSGVIDRARYDIKAGRFIDLTIKVATTGITRIVWSDNQSEIVGESVWCDNYENVIIEL